MSSDFDRYTILPGYSTLSSRAEVDLSTRITADFRSNLPFMASPMSTVTKARMAIAIAKVGGIGAIHRYLKPIDQHEEVRLVKEAGYPVGAAIGATKNEERVDALMKEPRPDFLIGDVASGDMESCFELLEYIRKTYGDEIQVISGNIATARSAEHYYTAGVDGFRVGIGAGSVCITRQVAGVGRNQLIAIKEIHDAFPEIPITSCGGVRYSGDIVKALAFGAESVVIGRLLAACDESPANRLMSGQVEYFGMASYFAEKQRAELTGEDPSAIHHLVAPEGKSDMLEPAGPVEKVIASLAGGVKAGLAYLGARTIPEFQKVARWE